MMNIEVVLSPALLHLSDIKNKNVVVIDILRASSTICTAIHEGAEAVKAVKNIEQAKALGLEGYITAAERNGQKIDGFDMGNSPFECMNGAVKGKKIALTTTNGTKCIEAACNDGAANVMSGSFLNLDSSADWLIKDGRDIVLFCAGWKDSFNLEDTLFAGAMASNISSKVQCIVDCDAALMAVDLFNLAKDDLMEYLKKSSHYKRLSHLHHDEDMVYCLQDSIFQTVVGIVDTEMKKM